ncbi:MAG: alkaline phosphatase family protein [Polyangiales bacterium]
MKVGPLATLCLALAAGCASTPRASTPPAARRAAPAPLVVAVVLDQMGSWVLQHHLPLLRDDGLLKPMIARGTWAHDVRLTYAGTYTGPGHAAIYTGAPPADSGVVANRVWDRERARMVSVVDDGEHAEFGNEQRAHAGPSALRVDTVADVLRRAASRRAGATRVAAISMKDRSAVIPGGQHPDLALWYTEEARGFTTSAYYAPATPDWLSAWNAAHPVSAYFDRPWEPLDAAALLATGMTDEQRGEGDWHGLGATFPHLLSRCDEPYSAFLATPWSTEHLAAMARAVVSRLDMGGDAAPDLLMLSVSGSDYVGHVFGPESWESMDNLVRVDAMLGALARELSARGPVSVLVTADHGVMPLVERAPASERAARIEFADVTRAAEEALDRALGDGEWVAAYVQPYVYLRPAALAPAVRERAIATAAEAIARLPGVASVARTSEAVGWRSDPDPTRRAVAESVDPRVAGELFVVPAEGSVVDERMPEGFGTSHGSPYPRDQSVPLIVSGPGVPRRELREARDFRSIAATLAWLLDVTPPAAARRAPVWEDR